jgi:hypothetical protein
MVLEGDRLDAALLVKAGGLIIVVGKLFRIADRLLGLTVVPRTGANLAFVGIGDPALLRQSQARQTGGSSTSMFIGWRNWTNSKRLCARKSSTTSPLISPKKEPRRVLAAPPSF